jgi:plastocyanin
MKFGIAIWVSVMTAVLIPQVAKAQVTYTANVGAETNDEAVQANGFFPNELWLLEGDSIKWTFVPKNEVHTVAFLMPGQLRPQAPPPVGPPFAFQVPPSTCTTASVAATYNGTACVSSNPLSNGITYTVTFPTAGNYKLVCLVHTDMNGTIHVLVNNATNANLVHHQQFYDDQAHNEAQSSLFDDDLQGQEPGAWDNGNMVTVGIGEIAATGGGLQVRSVVRFLPGTIRIHAGQSVLWTNLDPTEPHTVTFGTEPTGFVPTLYSLPPALLPPVGPPIPNPPSPCTSTVTTNCLDPDAGTLIGTINCTTSPAGTAGTTPCYAAFNPQENSISPPPYDRYSFLSSGFIQAQAPDRTGSPQLPPGTTRIRITFPNPGTYYYHCALHDVDGMYGTVIVE